MKQAEVIGFPTVGELLQFVYDAFGVLPRKHSLPGEFDETQKKTIQHALERLRKEDGDINENIGKLLATLGYLVTGHVPNPRINLMMNEVICDIGEVYLAVLKDDGTYWNKEKTIQWVINDFLISRLVFSLHKHFLSFNVVSEGFETPGSHWYLPEFSGGRIVMPLERVMRWIYAKCEMSQTAFHSLMPNGVARDYTADRRLENAQNWIKCQSPPSLAGLMMNFNVSFDRLEVTGRLTTKLREAFCIILVLARVSTYVCNAALKTYGAAYLEQICAEFKEDDKNATAEFSDFKEGTYSDVDDEGLSGPAADKYWMEQTHTFCKAYELNVRELSQELRSIPIEEHVDFFLDESNHRRLVTSYGPLAVGGTVRKARRGVDKFSAPMEFWEMLDAGLSLRRMLSMSDEQLAAFELELQQSGVEHMLTWLVPWLKAIKLNWKGDYKLAFPLIEMAFKRAKYCAGGNQKAIAKLFLSIAAKCQKKVPFRRGVMWAQYIGLDFPWLRAGHLSQEDLDDLREEMQRSWCL